MPALLKYMFRHEKWWRKLLYFRFFFVSIVIYSIAFLLYKENAEINEQAILKKCELWLVIFSVKYIYYNNNFSFSLLFFYVLKIIFNSIINILIFKWRFCLSNRKFKWDFRKKKKLYQMKVKWLTIKRLKWKHFRRFCIYIKAIFIVKLF